MATSNAALFTNLVTGMQLNIVVQPLTSITYVVISNDSFDVRSLTVCSDFSCNLSCMLLLL